MGKSLKNMMGRLLIIALAVCFCDAAPTTDLVVPEYLDFAAFSKLAPTAFLQAVIKSGGTEAECRSFATTTINTISESVKSEGAILNAVDTGAGCASKGQELVQVAQGRLEAKEGVLAAKEGSAEEARNAKTAACTAAVDMSVGLDTLKKTTCYDYSSEASFISTDAACNQATTASSQATAAVVSATTDVQYAQGEVQDAVAEAARLESGCLCRVHQEQAAAQVAAQTATTAHADDWKQAQEVLCAVDQTTPCPMPPCPTVTQPTLAAGVANADTQHCTPAPTTEPTASPSASPTASPTATPTATPTAEPTDQPISLCVTMTTADTNSPADTPCTGFYGSGRFCEGNSCCQGTSDGPYGWCGTDAPPSDPTGVGSGPGKWGACIAVCKTIPPYNQ